MFSRYAGYRRRGSVLILVVGVLAMLFVIGTTQLMVARFEKQNAETKSSARDLKGVVSMLYLPMAEMFQNDALAATNADLDPALQDWADFGGTASLATIDNYVDVFLLPYWNQLANKGVRAADIAMLRAQLKERLLLGRSGDGLIASLEPHWDPAAGQFRYFSISLGLDSFPNLAAVNDSLNSVPPGSFRPVITFGDPSKTVSNPVTDVNQLHGNAEGSGVTDSLRMDVALSSLYEGKYKMFQRVISHGGMVMLDRTTHPALLAQVIHPSDTQAHSDPAYLFDQGWSRTSTDEERLRRRGYLPESTQDYGSLLSNDLRRLIPYTLGYDSARYRNVSPHWWPVGSDHTVTVDEDWWHDRMRPMVALTEGSYSENQDQYDRRHLLTTHSYDDLLRPQRSEARLLQLPDGVGGFTANLVLGQYFHVINPTATSDTSYNRFETQGRLAYQFDAAGNPTAYSPEPLAYGVIRTGFNPFSLQFNRPGLRTPFSLRDTLVVPNPASYPTVDEAGTVLTWTYQASLKRFVQLTGYYLAMIQNTTVPGAARTASAGTTNPTLEELYEQFHTAAQLAVNTIDFADNADVTGDGRVNAADVIPNASNPIDPLTAFTYRYDDTIAMGGTGSTTKDVTVYGFEKQPFITEAYVKNIHKPVKVGESYDWLDEPDTAESIYAVELYNPYSEALALEDFALEVSPNVYADLAALTMAPHSYIVLANTSADVALPRDPFVGVLGTTLFTTKDGHLTMLTYTAGTEGDGETPGTPATTSAGGSFRFAIPEAGAAGGGGGTPISISLVRKSVLHLGFSAAGDPVARLETATDTNGLGARAVVDTLTPNIVGTDSAGMLSDNLATDVRFGAIGDTSVRGPEDDTDLLIAESSLQRRKDLELFGGVYRPIHWHFTIARQMVFPLPWDEHVENADHVVNGLPHPLTRPEGAVPQHNLLGTAEFTNSAGTSNQAVMARYMEGLALNISVAGALGPYQDGRLPYLLSDPSRMPILDIALPVAPVQLVTSDLGLDAYGRCRAYPTTGTLLLVSRHAHVKDGTVAIPVTNTFNIPPKITDQRNLMYGQMLLRDEFDQLRHVDNGHLPVFDPEQVVLGEPRRLQMPWGQLVFDYFTTLPVEELFQLKDLSLIGGPSAVRLIDLYNESNPTDFENAYKFVVNGVQAGSAPVQEVVSASGTRTIGPKVRGRINVNMAPWWVLDGLPVLPDAYWEPEVDANYGLYNGLPVPELVSDVLDPATFDDVANTRAARRWLTSALTEPAHAHTSGFATLHPALARYLVSYREKRRVEGQGPVLVMPDPVTVYGLFDEIDYSIGRLKSYFARSPGYVGVGALCDVPRRIPLAEYLGGSILYQNTPMPAGVAFNDLRLQVHAGTGRKPFAYLGYLQLVAPVVRLQDWATVKSHVYTIYNLVGDDGTPPIWLRSQTTIDRTRCLYTNDLPEKIVHTEPISYFNAVTDQK